MPKKDYDHLGGGSFDVFKEKPKSFWESAGEIIGGIFVVFVVLGIIGAIVG